MTTTGLSCRVWNGTAISRRQDGYVNATAMCQANGKRLNDYIRCERTRQYVEALALDAGIPATDIVHIRRGGTASTQGTWIHPRLAVDLARWISPQFAVWMDGWFLQTLQGHAEPAQEVIAGNGRIDYALTLLHEAIASIDPQRSFQPTSCDIWVQRRSDSPAPQFKPVRNPALPDLPFSKVRRIRTAAG